MLIFITVFLVILQIHTDKIKIMAGMSKEEYLKRYLSNDQTDPSEKKKKKKKKKDKDKPIAKVLPRLVTELIKSHIV